MLPNNTGLKQYMIVNIANAIIGTIVITLMILLYKVTYSPYHCFGDIKFTQNHIGKHFYI